MKDIPGETPLAGESELRLLQHWFAQNPSDAKAWRVLIALITESLKSAGGARNLFVATGQGMLGAVDAGEQH